MSGHSKWSQIKRQKGAADAARGKLFTKLGKEIHIAVKSGGGGDPATNAKLRDIMAKARAANMPGDNIQRFIKRAMGEGSTTNYEVMTYEGYGVAGVAVIVEALTDNKNRTAGEVRHIFDRCGGSLGVSGAVSFMFDRVGIARILKVGISEDRLLEILIDSPVKDINENEDIWQMTCDPANLATVTSALEAAGVAIQSTGIEWLANNFVTVPEDKTDTFSKMLDMLEECDDVQEVFHNAE